MANAGYRKVTQSDGTSVWMNQNCPGAPDVFRVTFHPDTQLWYAEFTYNGGDTWFPHTNPQPTAAQMQAILDTYVGNLNAGTA